MQTIPETILLVDDEPQVRAVIRDVLELKGFTVLEAGDAVEAAKVEAGVVGPIHLLLTDVVTAFNQTYTSTSWLTPTAIQPARYAKISAQFDF